MEAGELDKLVTIQEPTYTTTDSGGTVLTWSALAAPPDGKVWGRMLPKGGKETLLAMQTVADVDMVWQIRYLSTITPKMKVIYGSRTWNVVVVMGDERVEEMNLLCKEEL